MKLKICDIFTLIGEQKGITMDITKKIIPIKAKQDIINRRLPVQ